MTGLTGVNGVTGMPVAMDVSAVDTATGIHRRRIARKILAEFCHERLLTPIRLSGGPEGTTYLVLSDDHRTEYLFRAEILPLEHWVIDATSVRRMVDGADHPVDPVALILDVHGTIGLDIDSVPAYLEELIATIGVGADRPDHLRLRAADLVDADFATVEAAMTEGHPCIVANAGRVGFSADDLDRYAPERAPDVHMMWVAARRDRCDVAVMPGVDIDRLVAEELGAATVARFENALLRRGLRPEDFCLVPVHPWQWTERIARVLAPDVAESALVPLGPGPDVHRPQQSIRTLLPRSGTGRHYVKVALSIANMGFTRGMSADHMRTIPPVNAWLRDRVGDDPYLASLGFRLLHEIAAVGYRSPAFDAITAVGSEYRKLLSALWRESPTASLTPGQRPVTMAALLHLDESGAPFAAALIARSGIQATDWIRRYLRVYLHPVMYLLHRHDLTFSPHGENLILLVENSIPVGAFLKDLGEEVGYLGDPRELPADCGRIAMQATDEVAALAVLSDVVDDFLRPLSGILHEAGVVDGREFWDVVADSVVEFTDGHPDLATSLRRRDMFVPDFGAIPLNRLQMRNTRRMVDPSESYAALVDPDHRLVNPIASAGVR